jgi:glycosyltransferase involved in cell wall biosynthesis
MYTVQCAGGLARAGHEVHVLTLPLPADAKAAIPAGVTVHEVDPTKGEGGADVPMPLGGEVLYRVAVAEAFGRRVRRLASEGLRFDVIEGPEYEAAGMSLILGEVPVITHVHSGSAIARHGVASASSPTDAETALREAIELHAMMGSDALCAPSQSVIDDTRRAYDADAVGGLNARVIPLPFTPPRPPGMTDAFTLPAPDAPVLYVGRLEQLKGAHLLAQAAVAFLSLHPQATLHIIGPDTLNAPDATPAAPRSMARWMQDQIPSALAGRVQFLGERTSAEIAVAMRAAAFVVIPSLRESYSYVCCEALAAGRAVVVSTGIGATEVAGAAGVPFTCGSAPALADAMSQLWSDRPLCERLSRLAWERSRTDLSCERAIEKRLAFYHEVIARRRQEGIVPAEARLRALPQRQQQLVALARELHAGHMETAEVQMRQMGLEPLRTAGMRLTDRLKSGGGVGGGGGAAAPRHFYLYGAGRHTGRLLLEKWRWQAAGYELAGIIDDHPRFAQDPHAFGLPVMSCAAARERLRPGEIVILSTDAFEEQFWKNTTALRDQGIVVYRLYT